MTATTCPTPACTVAAVLAQHPVEWWLVGMLASALVGALALTGLRAAQRHGTLRPHQGPGPAHREVLAALGASACALVLAGAMLAALAESARHGSMWSALDNALAAAMSAQVSKGVLQWFATLTHLGDAGALTIVTVMVALALWVRQHRLLALGWLLALAGNGALTRILKAMFERARPEHLHGIAYAHGYSFPSGHSSASMAAYTMLAYLAARLLPRRWHLPVVLAAGAMVFTTGWSRVVLQVHYASDVLAGWLLAGTWVLCSVLIMESVLRWRGRQSGLDRA